VGTTDESSLPTHSCVPYLHKRNAAQGVTLKTQRMLLVVSRPWGVQLSSNFSDSFAAV
jgi:hypothetical protein